MIKKLQTIKDFEQINNKYEQSFQFSFDHRVKTSLFSPLSHRLSSTTPRSPTSKGESQNDQTTPTFAQRRSQHTRTTRSMDQVRTNLIAVL